MKDEQQPNTVSCAPTSERTEDMSDQRPEFEVPLPSDAAFAFDQYNDFDVSNGEPIKMRAITERTMTFVGINTVLKPGRYAVVLLEKYAENDAALKGNSDG